MVFVIMDATYPARPCACLRPDRVDRRVPRNLSLSRRLATAVRWPPGVALTAWHYMWRTTPMKRRELPGSPRLDAPPDVPCGIEQAELQRAEDGVGPFFHRRYRARIRDARLTPQELVARLAEDPNRASPTGFASFHLTRGVEGALRAGDELLVRMAGPWDGPVRVLEATPVSFRLVTLDGHLEAGQIEFRARDDDGLTVFEIESWARSGDALSALLYERLRLAKEVQLHMWTSFLEGVLRLSGGRRSGPFEIETWRVDGPVLTDAERLGRPESRRALDELHRRRPNFDPAELGQGDGWHVDDLRRLLPQEPPGEPLPDSSWELARRIMRNYELADPATVRAHYDPEAPLDGRDMLLELRIWGLRFHMGVRVAQVFDEVRTIDGHDVRVWGWAYDTLEGHLEMGRMDWEVRKWLDSGEVDFHIRAVSRRAPAGTAVVRLGFRLLGRRRQLRFYVRACERIARLTECELERALVAEARVGEPAIGR
jgi:uncharacterized protein (UPF0548 family)